MSARGEIETIRPLDLRPGVFEALFVEGWAFDQRHEVTGATLRIGSSHIPAVAIDVERPDIAHAHADGPWRSPYAATSGLLLAGVVGPLESGEHPFQLHLELASGASVRAVEGAVTVAAATGPIPCDGPPADVAIAMATYNPDDGLFRRQIESIRNQDYRSWFCVISDDGSSRRHRTAMREALGDDDRFVLVEHRQRVGFYLNFERALAAVPTTVSYVALSDQDDLWYPDKLRRQIAILDADAAVQLVASDVRVTGPDGSERSPTFYAGRAPTHDDPYSLFTVNSLIGASMVFRRSLLNVALPFPRAFEDRYHDHWLARSALVCGEVEFVSEPLHDYVQHSENVFGHRRAIQWPLGPIVKPALRTLAGGGSLPSAWRDNFVNFPLECAISARLLRHRVSAEVSPPWLQRVATLDAGQLRELSRIVVDHARERRTDQPRRENVEISLFTGRSWAMDHRPRSVRA